MALLDKRLANPDLARVPVPLILCHVRLALAGRLI